MFMFQNVILERTKAVFGMGLVHLKRWICVRDVRDGYITGRRAQGSSAHSSRKGPCARGEKFSTTVPMKRTGEVEGGYTWGPKLEKKLGNPTGRRDLALIVVLPG